MQNYSGQFHNIFIRSLIVSCTFLSSVFAQSELAQFEGPLPAGCIINEADLVAPPIPEGMTRAVRFVEINGNLRFSLTTGELAEFLLATNQVEPNPDGHNWGEGCRGRVRFAFVNDAPAEPTDPSGGGQASSTVSSTGAQAPTTTDGQSSSATVALIEPDETQCTPPLSSSPQRVLVPDVRFLSRGCLASTTSVRPDAAVTVEYSRFPDSCTQWSEVVENGFVAEHSAIVGIVLPGGSRVSWGLDVGRSASWVEHERPPYQGEEYQGPILKESAFSNGVMISEEEKGYATLVPVSLLPYWSGSQVALPKPEESAWPQPSPIFRLNSSTSFSDLFFGSDFELIGDDDTGSTDGFTLELEALARNVNGQPIATTQCSENLVFEISTEFPNAFQDGETVHETPVEFFDITTQDQTGLPDDGMQVVLESGETYSFSAQLKHYLSRINEQHHDLLFGASITIKAWVENEPDEILDEVIFSVYRFVDASDDEHNGRSVAMARTLGDGPGKVVRKRRVDVAVVDSADFTIQAEGDNGFSFNRGEARSPSYFLFDPHQADERQRDLQDHLTIIRKSYNGSDIRQVTRLPIIGTAEPKNKVFFNIDTFEDVLSEIYIRSNTAEYAQLYGDYDVLPKKANGSVDISNTGSAQLSAFSDFLKVHPALITEDERAFLVHPAQQAALAEQIKTRMTNLWGQLMQGIEWTDAEDPDNTVKILWEVRKNLHWKSPFALGVSLNESGGREGTDNYHELAVLVRTIDSYNDAEAAYRLSKAMNPGHRKDIHVYMDSILESHRGNPSNYSPTLSEDEFIKAVSKTALHEAGHTFSLSHVVQRTGVSDEELNEVQILRIPQNVPEITFGFGSESLTLTQDKLERINGEPSYKLTLGMTDFQNIGVANMNAEDPGEARGIYVIRCDEDSKSFAWVPHLVRSRCLLDDGGAGQDIWTVDNELWVATFANHLQGYDMPEITLSNGSVETFRDGKSYSYVEMNAVGNACQYAIIDTQDPKGPSQLAVLTDIMHGGLNDISGALSFHPKVSLELMKIALALDYSGTEAKDAIHVLRKQVEGFDRYGGNDFKSTIKGDWDKHCKPLEKIESTTGAKFTLP